MRASVPNTELASISVSWLFLCCDYVQDEAVDSCHTHLLAPNQRLGGMHRPQLAANTSHAVAGSIFQHFSHCPDQMLLAADYRLPSGFERHSDYRNSFSYA